MPRYPVVLTPDENGTVIAEVPDIPGTITFGQDEAQALDMALDAAFSVLCHLMDSRQDIPPPRNRRKPPHPGGIIRRMHMEQLHLTVTQLAAVLGISHKTLSKIINERAGLSPDMALRLSRAFNTTPELWLNLQKFHDLWIAEHELTG